MTSEEPNAKIVREFVLAWHGGLEAIEQSFNTYLTEDVKYENIGLTNTSTLADAIDIIDNFLPGLDHIAVDILAESATGSTVFNERVDHLRAADGSTLISIRVAGVFEIRGDRISGWRDYFDTASIVKTLEAGSKGHPTAHD